MALASGKEGTAKAKLEAEWWEGKRWESGKGEGGGERGMKLET